jgi:hypothetical protein
MCLHRHRMQILSPRVFMLSLPTFAPVSTYGQLPFDCGGVLAMHKNMSL